MWIECSSPAGAGSGYSKRRDLPEIVPFLGAGHPSLEAQVVDAADSLAYNAHDVDDALDVGIINIAELADVPLWKQAVERARAKHKTLTPPQFQPTVVRALIDWQVSDLLSQARQLHAEGYFVAAGMTARVVMERALRERCRAANCVLDRQETIQKYADALYRAGKLDLESRSLVRRVAKIAHRTAHGVNIDPEQIGELVASAQSLFESDAAREAFALISG